MQTFLNTQGITSSAFMEAKLRSTNREAIAKLKHRIEFVDTLASKQIRESDGYTLTKGWWTRAKPTVRTKISSCIYGLVRSSELDKRDLFYTMPKTFCKSSSGFKIERIGSDPVGKDLSTQTFIACNKRSTNLYQDKRLAVHAFDLRPQQAIKAYLQDQGQKIDDDIYARNMLIQWLWRGCVRKDTNETMKVCILSARMDKIFKDWLNSD
jgi:hypothetical protein